MNQHTPTLSIGVFLLLRDLLRDRLGVSFEEDKQELLASKLSDRLAALGLRTFLDYYYRLKYGPDAASEWTFATEALSVQETYFWREADQVRTLVDVLIPQHIAAGRGPIRIWSAACATGEEPFTLVMALAEAGWFDKADIQVWASDISPAALEKANRGIYRDRSFRALPDHLRAKHFTPVDQGWQISPSLLAKVRFTRANLLDESEIALLAQSTYIFCRNVFIYFSPATIEQVVAQFASRMPRPGYLFVGASESLLRVKNDFELDQIGSAFVYTLREGGVCRK